MLDCKKSENLNPANISHCAYGVVNPVWQCVLVLAQDELVSGAVPLVPPGGLGQLRQTKRVREQQPRLAPRLCGLVF